MCIRDRLKGVAPGQLYGYRAYGPDQPDQGLRFDPAKVLLDPYAYAVTGGQTLEARAAAGSPGDNCALAMKSVVVDLGAYDWEGDTCLLYTSDAADERSSVD